MNMLMTRFKTVLLCVTIGAGLLSMMDLDAGRKRRRVKHGTIERGTGDVVSTDPSHCDNRLDPECALFFSPGSPGYWDYQHYRVPGMPHKPLKDHWYCPELGRYMTAEECRKTEDGRVICGCEGAYKVREAIPGHEEPGPAEFGESYASSPGGEGYR